MQDLHSQTMVSKDCLSEIDFGLPLYFQQHRNICHAQGLRCSHTTPDLCNRCHGSKGVGRAILSVSTFSFRPCCSRASTYKHEKALPPKYIHRNVFMYISGLQGDCWGRVASTLKAQQWKMGSSSHAYISTSLLSLNCWWHRSWY